MGITCINESGDTNTGGLSCMLCIVLNVCGFATLHCSSCPLVHQSLIVSASL